MIEVVIGGSVGVGIIHVVQWLWRRRKRITICPKCKKRGVWKTMQGTDEISRCANCNWQLYKHGKPEKEQTRSCPRCSGSVHFGDAVYGPDQRLIDAVWTCRGYPDRASIVAQRGEAMTPKSLQSIPSCKWTGRDSDYGRTWR